MSYERSFVIGVFGRELLKRQIDGDIPDRPAGKRIRFAREARYKTITLWTYAVLKAARAIYQQAGFQAKSGRGVGA